jgi:cell division protein FtsB
MAKRRSNQFSVRRLLVLTTAFAAACGGLAAIHLPEMMRAGLIAYSAVIILWVVFRWPDKRAELIELRRRREQLAADVDRLKGLGRQPKEGVEADHPITPS